MIPAPPNYRRIVMALGWVALAAAVFFIFVIMLNKALVSPAGAADLFTPDRPQGFAGVGHVENHAHYEGLRSPEGASCCAGKDCRPTVARFDGGRWEVKVNGIWRDDFSAGKVLSDAWLRLEQARLRQPVEGRWNTEAHVCASFTPGPRPMIYCVILSDEWN